MTSHHDGLLAISINSMLDFQTLRGFADTFRLPESVPFHKLLHQSDFVYHTAFGLKPPRGDSCMPNHIGTSPSIACLYEFENMTLYELVSSCFWDSTTSRPVPSSKFSCSCKQVVPTTYRHDMFASLTLFLTTHCL